MDGGGKEYLTESEMMRFLNAARSGRHGVRDFAMMLMAYRHGLRVSELVDIRLTDLDLVTARLFVRRKKGSLSTHQPIEGDELRAIRAWIRRAFTRQQLDLLTVSVFERTRSNDSTGFQLFGRSDGATRQAPFWRTPSYVAAFVRILSG